MLTIEYLKIFISVVDEVGNEKWVNDDVKTSFLENLQDTPQRDPYANNKKDYKVLCNDTVDSVMKLTMLRYPMYMKKLMLNKGESLTQAVLTDN